MAAVRIPTYFVPVGPGSGIRSDDGEIGLALLVSSARRSLDWLSPGGRRNPRRIRSRSNIESLRRRAIASRPVARTTESAGNPDVADSTCIVDRRLICVEYVIFYTIDAMKASWPLLAATLAASSAGIVFDLADAFAVTARPNSIRPCASSAVHYESALPSRPHSTSVPWALGKGQSRVIALLASHTKNLHDERIRTAGLTIFVGRPQRIWWIPAHGAGGSAIVVARRLDGNGLFRTRARLTKGRELRSEVTVPAEGCWQFTLSNGRVRASVTAMAVLPRSEVGCDMTPLAPGNPPSVSASPTSSGIVGRPFFSEPGADHLMIFAGGRAPDGRAMKILWQVKRQYGPTLAVAGVRLDASGAFRQVFRMASSPGGNFPSIVNVPAPGCWALMLRTGQVGGVIVVRAI